MQRRMGGRFFVVPIVVYDTLMNLTRASRDIYFSLLSSHYVEEFWDGEGEWVTGKIKTSKIEVINKAGVSKTHFYTRAWPALTNAGLVAEEGNGIIILPKFKKKSDATIGLAEIRQIVARLDRIEQAVLRNERIHSEAIPQSELISIPERTDRFTQQTSETSASIYRSREEEIRRKEEGAQDSLNIQRLAEEAVGSIPNPDWVGNLVQALWPGYNLKGNDGEAIAGICKFPVGDIKEAFAAARKHKVMRGKFDWILNRLVAPERFREVKNGNKRKNSNGSHPVNRRSNPRSSSSNRRSKGRVGSKRWPEIE